jgi:trimethylamine:corrinoid methyltransferase-like protein
MFAGIDFKADFLKQKITRQLFRQEQYLPSDVIDRGSIRAWQEAGKPDTFARAKTRVMELLSAYQRPAISSTQESALGAMLKHVAHEAGMDMLPALENS